MTVTMKDVRALLDPDEPDYNSAAALGTDALPHLAQLADGGDAMLASKATYAASLIGGEGADAVVHGAARNDDPVVRVAAAAASANLRARAANDILEALIADTDAGVRKIAQMAVPEEASDSLRQKLQHVHDESSAGDAIPIARSATGGLMPGERSRSAQFGEPGGLMPGEDGGEV
ncbi:hypothetical protein [Gordonia sp. KTR9]|uniref:hypothetical protein n=1 Tax=Gordonia sp. KTR9 TaxID=337191 RepID=UPI00027DDCC5|nr:hypothetical protein [Gordonia sp. KTR9]AFR47721.1 hypothetical protein KTR9_1078 [Gordonia sp. KTR9]